MGVWNTSLLPKQSSYKKEGRDSWSFYNRSSVPAQQKITLCLIFNFKVTKYIWERFYIEPTHKFCGNFVLNKCGNKANTEFQGDLFLIISKYWLLKQFPFFTQKNGSTNKKQTHLEKYGVDIFLYTEIIKYILRGWVCLTATEKKACRLCRLAKQAGGWHSFNPHCSTDK